MNRYGMLIGLVGLALVTVATAVKGRASEAAPLAAGAEAPDFTLPSQENKPVSLSDYKGKWVVLYFYPKDKTSGCTIEAHNFQRDLAKFTAAGAVVLGVSLDTAESHQSFCTQESLTFKLLADPQHKVVDAYGVPVNDRLGFKYASRWTYLIAPDGHIAKVWTKVDVNSHSEEVLAAIAAEK
jgi:peroxiredoxin Q/BCP